MSGASWGVVLRPAARKDLRRLDPPVRTRVVRELERLAAQGPAQELVRLKGRPESRLRIGDWRAIVEVDRAANTIRVKRVLPRGRAYER